MTTHKLSPNLAVSESGFLFLTTTGETFTANPVGREIILALQSGKSDDEILQSLTSEYDVPAAAAERDFHDFVAHLRHHGLLVSEPKAGGSAQ